MKECVVILGMHRSGTSALTGLVSFFGGYVGSDLMPPTKDNPKGYFENNKIYVLNEKILKENGTSWDDYIFVADDISKERFQKYVFEAKEIIEDELKYVKKIIIKDPRICILFPIWEQALNELEIDIKIVLAYRSPLEVAHSLQKRDEIAVEKGLMLWSHYFLESEKYSRNYPRLIVEYDNDFQDISMFLEKISKFIGDEVTEEVLNKANDFYSPKLKHHQVALSNISGDLPSYLKDLIKILANKKFDKISNINKIRNEFNYSKKYYLYNQQQQEKTLALNENEIIQLEKQLAQVKEELKHKLSDEEELTKHHKKLQDIHKNLEDNNKDLERRHEGLEQRHEGLEQRHEELEGKYQGLEVEYKKRIETSILNEEALNGKIARKDQEIESKEKGLAILTSSYIWGDELFQKLISNSVYYKKLHRNIGITFTLKLRQKLLPFAKKRNKRLMREKILIIESGLFSPFFYLTINPDVKASSMDPLSHFCENGWKEGRNPSLSFDLGEYLRKHPDVARAKINPLLHYIKSGKKEGRQINSVVLYGKRSDSLNKKKLPVHRPLDKDETTYHPVTKGRGWEKTISASVTLRKSKKLVNKKVPEDVINFSKKQLEKRPLKVTVIMPTWNREKSICDAIDSIFSQSYLPSEIIISDDGSTDGTIELLRQRYEKYISSGLIKVLFNNHEGVSAARNSALAEASGDLIAYLDSDNTWREHYLLIMTAAFSENDELNCAYSALQKHDSNNKTKNKFLGVEYDRKRLLDGNFIDLNVFVHRSVLFEQFGGFDTKLKRLVDWELIIRYTKNYEPAFISFVGVDYYLDDENLKNITTTVSLDDNRERVYQSHFTERLRYGLESLRLAYVLWDFPALSQTFVIEELKWLVQQGYNVIVYYATDPDKSAVLDFEIESFLVKDADHLSSLLEEHQRNFCHSHFAYPTVTRLTYPACVKAKIPFTFMPHAVDIFHHENIKRNKIGEITQHPLCLKVLVHGEFHKKFIENCGVPSNKIAFNIQAVNVSDFTSSLEFSPVIKENKGVMRGVVISRFVEKKGLNTLIEAASLLKNEAVVFDIYGYGPLEEEYNKQIKDLGLDNVILKGALTNQQAVAKAYEESDFLIAPCVVAKNGDMDGFPTVILEAMAVGLPVITTDIAAIPDYLTDGVEALVSPAGDVEQIAESVRKLKAMSLERKIAMIKRSQDFLKKKIGVKQTMQMLLDTWQGYTLDIFLVTFNTEKYEDRKETFEIINRIFKYTTTPFTLTIVDNNSDEDFWDEVCKYVKGYPNVRLIRKYQNIYCGPASNIALELSDSEYAIYVCSKEGFIKKHGWERTLLEYMRNNPDDAIAGHYSQMPKYIYGKEYQNHPDFKKFRNQDFAKKNPDRIFKHVQGGVYIIRRDFIIEHAGFNPKTPHGGMDVEMSYYIESLGYSLGEIPEVASLTTKTRPTLTAITNEQTVVAHPFTIESVANELDMLTKLNGHRCNICSWNGESFVQEIKGQAVIQKCPECFSTGFGRSMMKILANSSHIYRDEICLILSDDKSFKGMLNKLFKVVSCNESDEAFLQALEEAEGKVDFYIIDPELIHDSKRSAVWHSVLANLSPAGEVVFADRFFQDELKLSDASISSNKKLVKELSKFDKKYLLEYQDHSSYCIAYDWRRFGMLRQALVNEALGRDVL